MAINIESGAGAQPIGFIGALTGSAIARGADGVERVLQIGDPVYTNEVIITGELSSIVVDFVDGTRLDLGRDSQAVLDSDVFDPASLADVTDVAATAEAMQQAILAGKDPSEIFEAPAAGEEAVTDEGGTDAVTIDLTGQQVTPQSGFETTGIGVEFPEPPQEIPGVEEEAPIPVISIDDVTVTEPVEGTTTATFTVTLNISTTVPVTVNYATADIPGGAVAGQDYTATSGTLTFLPGETSQTIDVEVLSDNIHELSELFNVELSDPVNATTSDTGIGTILDSDPAPEITIDNITIYEGGEGGPATASFTITMSNPTYEDVTVNWSVSPDTASLSDYTGPTSGTATIAAGTTSVVVSPGLTFTAVDDSIYENPETFDVSLDSISGGDATIGDSLGVGTIISDDPAPEITIDDITIYEGGDGGPATLSFTITMSNPTYEDVTVNWSVSPDTASLSDYTGPTSGTATIAAGTTTVVVSPGLTFTAVDDNIYENPETFDVSLDSISGGDATIGDSTGVGTIISNDPAPEVTIDDITIYEGGEGGPSTATFTISMTNPTYEDVNVNWSLSDVSAIFGDDYTGPTSGTATIAAGTTTVNVSVPLTFTAVDDIIIEDPETFTITLDSVTGGGALGTGNIGTGTIISDDVASPNVLNGSIITNTNQQSQVLRITFTDTTDPSKTFTTLFTLEEQGQQGSTTLTEFAFDVGFVIDADTEYDISLQYVSGPKIIVTDVEIEGVVIHSKGGGPSVKLTGEPGTNEYHTLSAIIEPATQNPDGTFGGDGVLVGGTFDTTIDGTADAGDNVLVGTDGDDTLDGLAGNDVLHGGEGADELIGGDGEDTATYFDSTDGVNIDLGAGTASGGDAEGDTLTGIENVIGSDDKTTSDSLTGDSGDNILLGLEGDDILVGGAGNDTLVGGPGDDTISGGAGDDLIIGNADADSSLSGGSGADTFRYLSMNDVPDIIEDFDTTEGDVLDIAMVLDYDGSTSLDNYVQLDTTTSPGDTLVMVNPDGTGNPGDYEVLATLQGTPITDSVDDLVASGNLVVTEIF